MMTYPQKTIERRHGAAGDHVELAADALRLSRARPDASSPSAFDGLREELRAKPPRLDQGDGPLGEAGDDNPGQAGAGADVDPGRARCRLESQQLRRIEDMPLPQMLDVEAETRFCRSFSRFSSSRIGLEPLECFT